jgi:hypothetical protein
LVPPKRLPVPAARITPLITGQFVGFPPNRRVSARATAR